MQFAKFLFFLFLMTIVVSAFAQENELIKVYKRESWLPKLDSLEKSIGQNLEITNDRGLKLASLIALSHYPELQNRKIRKIRIIFKDRKGAPVEANFGAFNFIRGRKGKVYRIVIQTNSFMERLTLNQQVSAIGHEMAHFIQYDQRKYLGTLFSLARYGLSKNYRLKFEKGADEIAAKHGLKYQLLDFSFYSLPKEIIEYSDGN